MEIINHLLQGPNIEFINTPNQGGTFTTGYPDTIIIHYTAGASKESSVRTLITPESKASAHMVVGRDGSIVQLAPLNMVTWHAGKSEYKGRIGFNKYSIGIEIDNAGPLTKRSDGYYSWFNKKYEEGDVVFGTHRNETTPRYWHAYTEQQIQTVFDICFQIAKHYNIKMILGHEEISPIRKIDPGPAFPLDKLRDKILNSARNQDEPEDKVEMKEGSVTASKLNIRSAPDMNAEKVAMPLLSGVKVKILESKDGWFKVVAPVEGWVSSQYIK